MARRELNRGVWRTTAAFAVAVLALVLAACGGGGSDESSATAPAPDTTSAGATTAADTGAAGGSATTASGEKPTIVWLEQGAGNPYWDAQHAAAAEAGRRLGFDFKAVSGNLDPADQAATLKQLADQGVSVIMVNAIDPKAVEPSIKYAMGKGVPVVFLYGSNPDSAASITFDEIHSGEVAAEQAVKLLTERYGKPEGQIGVLTGILGQPASDLRAQGFTDAMKQYPDIEVVEVQPTQWQGDKAAATMQDWLVKYPDLALVYALSDTLAVPAMNVAERQNRLCTVQDNWETNPSCVIFISVDGIFLNEVQKGRLFSTELYSPEWSGYLYAQLADQVAKGENPPKDTTINALLVTPENADCVAAMTKEMTDNIESFPFDGTLQEIAEQYGCTVLDAS
jgi:ABC-type sugar transport system substrate-binding protein